MKTLTEHLSQYAAYHRHQRNVLTHFVGIPMIVLAIVVLLSRPALEVAGLPLTPALLLSVVSCIFYLRLDLGFGALMTLLLALALWCGSALASETTTLWLSAGVGLFVVGWALQFVGHYYEGRKPAFVDDISGLIIGPLFVLAEAVFLLGFRQQLNKAIEAEVGPLHNGKPAQGTEGGAPRDA